VIIDQWDTWKDFVSHRTERRVEIVLGKPLLDAVKARASTLGMGVGPFIKECVRHFLYHHPQDADPRK